MELLLIIGAIWIYSTYRKADTRTKERYKQKLQTAYERVLSETQKNYKASRYQREKPDYQTLTRHDNDRDSIKVYRDHSGSDIAPVPLRQGHTTPVRGDGPAVVRSHRFFGPNYED